MNDKQFRAFLDLLMCSDPWPVLEDFTETQTLVKQFANKESVRRGYVDWVDAYHKAA